MTVEYLHNLKFPKFKIFYLFRFFLFLILTFFHHHHSDIFNIFHLLHVGGYLWFIRNVNNFNRFSVCLKIQDLYTKQIITITNSNRNRDNKYYILLICLNIPVYCSTSKIMMC